MKLASFIYKNNKEWGVVSGKNNVIYLSGDVFGKYAPDTLLSFIEEVAAGENYKADFAKTYKAISFEDVKLLPPIANPIRNIFCVGKNYAEHVKELSDYDIKQFSPEAEQPIFFTKATTCANAPYGGVPMHSDATNQVDYEAELAVVIGKKGINIKAEKAYEHIFGYTALNDFTARDLQKDHKQWFKGKSLDGYCPMGPWIVMRDEVKNPQELDISLHVNGELRQSSNTSKMIFNIARLIQDLSKGMTLLPGDILATGTPDGVGAGFKPPRFLKKGDIVKVEIEDIGYIENEMI